MIRWYVLFINFITFLAFGWDKQKARNGGWRTPERTLFLLAAMGGAAGAWTGMYFFRHKTAKVKFTVGIPALLLLQAIAAWMFLRSM